MLQAAAPAHTGDGNLTNPMNPKNPWGRISAPGMLRQWRSSPSRTSTWKSMPHARSASCCSSRTCAHRGWKPHKPYEPQKPVGPDLGGGDAAPVAVEPLAHVHVEVHAARQVRLVLQQPHLRTQGMETSQTL